MAFNLKYRHFLKLDDFTPEEIGFLLDLSAELKAAKYAGTEVPRLSGKQIVLIFEKDSTRTRSSFEVAAYDQGAHITYIGPSGSHIGSTETIKDTARVLAVSFCFLGNVGYNIGDSLMIGAAKMGMDIRLAGPRSSWPKPERVDQVLAVARKTGARMTLTEDAMAAVRGCDFLYTDIWVSMGESPDLWGERIKQMLPYQVNSKLMDATGNPDTRFMHCLPSLHNTGAQVGKQLYEKYGLDSLEVTDEVFESKASIVFDQAENRLHTIKAVLVATLGG